MTFFPITISLIEGFGSAEHEATSLLRSMGANKWKRFRYVRLPSALRFFFAGLRIAITYAVVGAIFAEYVGSFKGLGIYMSVQRNQLRTDLVLAAVLVTALVSIMLFLATVPAAADLHPVVRQVASSQRELEPMTALDDPVVLPKVEVRDIQMSFPVDAGMLEVIDNISFSAHEGEFVSVIGPSDCGKSTMFNIMTGFERPTSGRVFVDVRGPL